MGSRLGAEIEAGSGDVGVREVGSIERIREGRGGSQEGRQAQSASRSRVPRTTLCAGVMEKQ